MRKKITKRKGKKNVKLSAFIFVVAIISFSITYSVFVKFKEINENSIIATIQTVKVKFIDKASHIKTPENVYSVYLTSCAATTNSFREHINEILKTTPVNSVVIDVKDYSGTVSFISKNKSINTENSNSCRVRDLKEYIEKLHNDGVYVIARLTAFQDPYYINNINSDIAIKTKNGDIWKDYKGISFVDAGAKDYWKYLVDISLASYYEFGFDEINFDYIRYPSDGNLNDVVFPITEDIVVGDPLLGKAKVVREFFQYIDIELRKKHKIVISADIFGQTAINKDDLNIGQILEYTLPYFDYIALMLYPSHFLNGIFGIDNPNEEPYIIIKKSLEMAVERASVLNYEKSVFRPWLQDFDYPTTYTRKDVTEQIKATYDIGTSGWMIWDPSNKYTPSAFISNN